MVDYSSYLTAENICISGGITGADELACITEKDVKENYQMVPIDGNMVPTRQVFIQFNQDAVFYRRDQTSVQNLTP